MPLHRAPCLLALALCAAGAAGAQEAGSCQEHKLFGDERRFDCAVQGKAGGALPRFVALFSGSHDDTMASLKLQAEGKELPCGSGSKAETMGEDGRVSLSCLLPVSAEAAGVQKFSVQLRWTHAEYEGFRLER